MKFRIVLALAAAFATLAIGVLLAGKLVSWVDAMPSNATSPFTAISLLVAAALVVVALVSNAKRRKAAQLEANSVERS